LTVAQAASLKLLLLLLVVVVVVLLVVRLHCNHLCCSGSSGSLIVGRLHASHLLLLVLLLLQVLVMLLLLLLCVLLLLLLLLVVVLLVQPVLMLLMLLVHLVGGSSSSACGTFRLDVRRTVSAHGPRHCARITAVCQKACQAAGYVCSRDSRHLNRVRLERRSRAHCCHCCCRRGVQDRASSRKHLPRIVPAGNAAGHASVTAHQQLLQAAAGHAVGPGADRLLHEAHHCCCACAEAAAGQRAGQRAPGRERCAALGAC
jgi:hypothetical protein